MPTGETPSNRQVRQFEAALRFSPESASQILCGNPSYFLPLAIKLADDEGPEDAERIVTLLQLLIVGATGAEMAKPIFWGIPHGSPRLSRLAIEDVLIGSEGEVVVSARADWRERDRCGVCRRRSPGFDLGEGRRRWRALDLGTTFAFVEADAPRVTCRRHGVVVCSVPWARDKARFTRAFEDQAAWLAVNTSKFAVAQLMRIAWRTVGGICERVAGEAVSEVDLLAGL